MLFVALSHLITQWLGEEERELGSFLEDQMHVDTGTDSMGRDQVVGGSVAEEEESWSRSWGVCAQFNGQWRPPKASKQQKDMTKALPPICKIDWRERKEGIQSIDNLSPNESQKSNLPQQEW